MMSDISTITAERTDLGTHVDLCAQRYQQLESRIESVEKKVDEIHTDIKNGSSTLKNTIIVTGGSIIVAIISAVSLIFVNMPK